MKIELTKKQYKNLLMMSHLANDMLGILGDVLPEETGYKKRSLEIEDLEVYLLEHAEDFECGNMVENFKGRSMMKDEIYEKMHEIVDEYNEYIFWDELTHRIGKRDFWRTVSEKERKDIERNNGWLPERIHELYAKYEKEFEKHGIDRIEIVE